MDKKALVPGDNKFNLKFLLVGNSNSGKTHLCGTYDLGPVHFYMADAGGEKSLFKLLPGRKYPITIDHFKSGPRAYNVFWKQLQEDAKKGFFDEMAEKNGLVVIPDSLTKICEWAIIEVAKRNGRTIGDASKKTGKPMRIQDWGQVGAWMKELVTVIGEIPCAVATICHLQSDKNDEGAVIERVPSIAGAYRYNIAKDFDEVYLLEVRGTKHVIHLKESQKFNAGSRLFQDKQLKDVTLNDIAKAVMESRDEITTADKAKKGVRK